VAVGDFNGDGKPDLVVASRNSYTVSVLLNTTAPGAATPSFATHMDFSIGAGPNSVTVGDFNGDGKPDLVVACYGEGRSAVSVLLNTTTTGATTPTFATPVNFDAGNDPRSVTVGDFNGDGKPDLVAAIFSDYGSAASVLVNMTAQGATTASFATHVDFATGNGPYSVAVGDFNGDGRPDFAVANYGGVSVLLNSPELITRAVAVGTITESDSPPVLNKIVFLQQPGDGAVLQPIPAVKVEVLDQFGNPVTTGVVTITVASGPPGGLDTVSTVSTPVDANGIAIFTNLIFDAVGTYSLTASYGAQVSRTSNGFAATVADLNLVLNSSQGTNGVPTVAAGDLFDLAANFTDRATIPLQALITWGDGSVTQVPVTVANQQGQFGATHVYPHEGALPVGVTVVDGEGRVVGAGALPGPVQVFPAEFGSVNVLYGQPGQTVSQSVTDPVTGITTTLTLTEAVGDPPGGYLLVTALKNFIPPTTAGVVQFLTSYDVRQHNLPADASAVVTVTFAGALPPATTPQLFYLDTKTDPLHPTEKLFRGPPQFNGQSVSFGLNPASTPRLKDLNGTVFTVAATVPGNTATVAISPFLASAALDAAVPVQTATFRTSTQLTLTLEPSQASQVSSTRSILRGDAVDGGGGDDSASATEALLEFLFDKWDHLQKFLFPHDAAGAGRTSDSPSPPATAPAAPEVRPPPSEPQESSTALDLFLRDPAPSFDWFVPTAPVSDAPKIGRPQRIERQNPAAFAAASAAGLGLYISRTEMRRKGRRSPAGKLK
jgi:FG-GAP-like repeat/FG-GAP repeat